MRLRRCPVCNTLPAFERSDLPGWMIRLAHRHCLGKIVIYHSSPSRAVVRWNGHVDRLIGVAMTR
jgi:hypothetical protein